jgi:spermidine/putrescine transport system substrate-binding protein
MPRRIPLQPWAKGSSQSSRWRSSRRRFLQGSAAALGGLALSNCRRGVSDLSSETGDEADTATPGTLYIYTWADYTDEALAQQFTEATGIEVKIDIYDSNEQMLAKMQAGGGANYSLIYPSDYMVTQMVGLGLLTTLDQSRLNGLDLMMEQWRSPAYDRENTHSVPYSWGTTGLIYNAEILTNGPEDWDYLWENQAQLAKRISLLDDVRETMGAVLKSLGYSLNSTDPAELEEAYQKLVELKPALASFKSFGWQDELLGGDLLVAMAYSVEAIPVNLENERFQYVVPASGATVWTDTMVIPASAPNLEAAYEWINFNLQPQVSADVVERLYFATPNSEALKLVSADLLSNTDLFPPSDLLSRCEALDSVGEASDLYDQYWTKLTSA